MSLLQEIEQYGLSDCAQNRFNSMYGNLDNNQSMILGPYIAVVIELANTKKTKDKTNRLLRTITETHNQLRLTGLQSQFILDSMKRVNVYICSEQGQKDLKEIFSDNLVKV